MAGTTFKFNLACTYMHFKAQFLLAERRIVRG